MAFRTLRLVCLVSLLLLAAAVVRNGLAMALAAENPAFALKLAPENAIALSERATELLEGGASRAGLVEAGELSRRAAAREAINVVAVRTMGAVADAQGNAILGRRLVNASERLSRRDFIGQLWLIEDAVRREQVEEALQHYDVALRVSRRAPDTLFPVLGPAAESPELLNPIATLIARKPPWAEAFLLYIASVSAAPERTAVLFEEIMRRGYTPSPQPVQTLIGRLLAGNNIEQAWHIYNRFHPTVSAEVVRDPNFQASITDPTPFDWSFSADGGASASPSVAGGRSGLSFEAPVGTGGVVARQLLVLRAGTEYRLASTTFVVQADSGSAPFWRLRCGESPAFVQLSLSIGESEAARATRPFQVPANCRSQWLELVVTSTERPEGIRGVIGSVHVLRADQPTRRGTPS